MMPAPLSRAVIKSVIVKQAFGGVVGTTTGVESVDAQGGMSAGTGFLVLTPVCGWVAR